MSNIKRGLAAIATEVLEDVRKETESVILSAEKEAKQVLRVAKEEADKTYETIVTEAAAKAEIEKQKSMSITLVDVRNRLLQTKEELVDSAFNKTFTRLKDFVETEDYHGYLIQLIHESVEKVGAQSLILFVNAKDKAWLGQERLRALSKKLRVDLKLSQQTETFIGGCKAQTDDEKILHDNTIENRLEQLRPTLRLEIAKILFGMEG